VFFLVAEVAFCFVQKYVLTIGPLTCGNTLIKLPSYIALDSSVAEQIPIP